MKTKLLSLTLAAILWTSSASAALIEGNIGWAGMWDRTDDVITFDSMVVLVTNGDLAGTGITMATDFAPVAVDLTSFAAVQLWSAGGFTLILDSISVLLDVGANTVINGTATMSSTNPALDPTHFAVNLSTNAVTFSGYAVPEPMTGMMLVSGLMALVTLRRRVQA